MSITEFQHWKAFYSLHPFGEFREELNIAKICASNAGGKLSDYMTDFSEEYKAPDTETLSKRMQAYFASMAGK